MAPMDRVLSVGYEGVSLDEMLLLLTDAGIRTLFDVRLNAISRKRGFSKTALRAALADAQIAYVHLPELGNPRDNRDGYSAPHSSRGQEVRATYANRMRESEASAALSRILMAAGAGPVAVFCFEHSDDYCHRRQVIEALTAAESVTLPI